MCASNTNVQGMLQKFSLSRLLQMAPHVPGVEQRLDSSTRAVGLCRAAGDHPASTDVARWVTCHSAGARAGNAAVDIGTDPCPRETFYSDIFKQ